MALVDDIRSDVSTIISTQWSIRKGQVVPSTTSVALSGGAVELDATFLYADLAKSSLLAKILDRRVVAKILKSFLATSTRLIKATGGTVLSFDGDRVLGIFVGDSKNTTAAKCGLHINWSVVKVIRPKFEDNYDSVKNLDFRIRHAVGIDTGTVLIVRAGARGDNDLISIGRAPSFAAKLSDVRESPYHTFITASVYNVLHKSSKFGKDDENMWESRSITFNNHKHSIYRSNWHWEP